MQFNKKKLIARRDLTVIWTTLLPLTMELIWQRSGRPGSQIPSLGLPHGYEFHSADHTPANRPMSAFPLPKKTPCKRWQNGQGQGGKKGGVKGEGLELKPLTFLAPEVKTIHDATNPQFSPSWLFLEMSNGNKISPSHFQLNFTLARETPEPYFRSKPTWHRAILKQTVTILPDYPRAFDCSGSIRTTDERMHKYFPPMKPITFYCKLLSLPILDYQKVLTSVF